MSSLTDFRQREVLLRSMVVFTYIALSMCMRLFSTQISNAYRRNKYTWKYISKCKENSFFSPTWDEYSGNGHNRSFVILFITSEMCKWNHLWKMQKDYDRRCREITAWISLPHQSHISWNHQRFPKCLCEWDCRWSWTFIGLEICPRFSFYFNMNSC